MVSLAKENLLHEKSKVLLSVAGVVLAVFLIFATTGLYCLTASRDVCLGLRVREALAS